MLKIEQYNSFFSIFVYLLILAPVVCMSLLGKKSKIFNIAISLLMIVLLLGFESLGMWEFVLFICGELLVIYLYYFISKKNFGKCIYYVALFASMVPIILVKIADRTEWGSYIGFIGISYISFKVWELIISIHDRRIESIRLIDVLGFLIFAPSFSSGPIARYANFLNETNKKESGTEYLERCLIPAVKNMIVGMLYKFVIAYLINEYIMSKCGEINIKTTIVYMYAYTLYLFFDFAGYSLMAIATGRLMGVNLPSNFNMPFLARNMKEFWERWHISLSTWFNDFLFSRIVLNSIRSGLIKNPAKAARLAYLITMMIMGLWHGLYLHYILYGLYQGCMLVLTDIWLKSKTFRKVKKMKHYNLVSRFVCFQVISFGMLIFSGFII